MAKKKRNFLADFGKHLDLSDSAYIHAYNAHNLYKQGKVKAADAALKKAERFLARARKLEPKT